MASSATARARRRAPILSASTAASAAEEAITVGDLVYVARRDWGEAFPYRVESLETTRGGDRVAHLSSSDGEAEAAVHALRRVVRRAPPPSYAAPEESAVENEAGTVAEEGEGEAELPQAARAKSQFRGVYRSSANRSVVLARARRIHATAIDPSLPPGPQLHAGHARTSIPRPLAHLRSHLTDDLARAHSQVGCPDQDRLRG